MFTLSPIYSARKLPNRILSQNHKINPDTNLHKTYTNIKHKMFEELVPSVSPLLKKHIRLGHAERERERERQLIKIEEEKLG